MKRTIIAALVAQGFAGAAWAGEEGVFSLGEIRVTAAPMSQVAPGSTSIDAAEIREYDKITVGDALEMAPGVNLSKVGARNEQMVYVRGFDLRQVPVYIDGIPVYVPYDGYVDLGRFTTFDLSRIDVAKGFSSMIYGANTLGGAINLVSRRPTKAFEGEVGGGATFTSRGEHNGTQGYANVGSRQKDWYVQAGLSWVNEDYFRLPGGFSRTTGEDGGKRDNSRHEDTKGSLKLAYTPNATDEYAISFVSQHGVKDVPPYAGTAPGVTPRYWKWPAWDKEAVYFLSNTRIGAHTLRVRAYHDSFENSLSAYDDATYTIQKKKSSFNSWYSDYTNGAGIEGDFVLGSANLLKAAYNIKQDIHREHNAGEPWRLFKDLTQSLALEDTHTFSNRLSLVTGLSYDRRQTQEAQDYNATTKVISDFARDNGFAFNGQAGLFYKLSETAKLHATVARKSRFPTIKDRYSYRMGSAIPNAGLQMEKANHYEVGYSQLLGGRHLFEVNVFHSDITNLIQSVRIAPTVCSTPPCSQMQNVGKATANGIELGLRGDLVSLEYTANYTYLNRENRSDPTVRLTDTPNHKLFAGATWRIAGGWSSTASVEAMSSRYSSTDGVQRASGFAVANLKGGYRFAGGTRIEAGMRNLFDRRYAYTEGFPEPGRTWFVQFNAPL